MRPPPGDIRILDTYWIAIDLLQLGPLPKQKDNTIRVNLTQHDPRCVAPVLLHDVELVVQYRGHRHATHRDEWWHDPRQP